MHSIPFLFNHVYIFIGCIDFSSWLGLACIVLFLIFTVHSYVAPTLNKKIIIFIIIIIHQSLKVSRLRLRLHGTLERFCMEPFRVGTDRLPVYTMPCNRSVQNRSFQSILA